MFRMSHLGPHTFVSEDSHHQAPEWIRQFNREERHRLIDEDRWARNSVLFVLASAMLGGMCILVATLLWFV